MISYSSYTLGFSVICSGNSIGGSIGKSITSKIDTNQVYVMPFHTYDYFFVTKGYLMSYHTSQTGLTLSAIQTLALLPLQMADLRAFT